MCRLAYCISETSKKAFALFEIHVCVCFACYTYLGFSSHISYVCIIGFFHYNSNWNIHFFLAYPLFFGFWGGDLVLVFRLPQTDRRTGVSLF